MRVPKQILTSAIFLTYATAGCTKAADSTGTESNSQVAIQLSSAKISSVTTAQTDQMCFGVNILADDLPRHQDSICSVELGLLVGSVAANQTITLEIPKGLKRRIQVVGFDNPKSGQPCPALFGKLDGFDYSKIFLMGAKENFQNDGPLTRVEISLNEPSNNLSLRSMIPDSCIRQPTVAMPLFAWISGSEEAQKQGAYGTRGIASAMNYPGGRQFPTLSADSTGKLWLFGGLTPSNGLGMTNDLWQFDPSTGMWTWMAGANIPMLNGDMRSSVGTYGVKGVAAASNTPGKRWASMSWIDASDRFWMLGGEGVDAAANEGLMYDLWMFDPSTDYWTWMAGSDLHDNSLNSGNYGMKGVSSSTNYPGARTGSGTWTDRQGDLWLFGGLGASLPPRDDVWRFSVTTHQWTWMAGGNTGREAPIFGTQGVANTANTPGARTNVTSITDANGRFWLFGGNRYANNNMGELNDLWMFDPTTLQWTWIAGSQFVNPLSISDVYGEPSLLASPSGRELAGGWFASGKIWIFGGFGHPLDSVGAESFSNDLWAYDLTLNRWIPFSRPISMPVYGSRGIGHRTNTIGSRKAFGFATSAGQSSGWLYGGVGVGLMEVDPSTLSFGSMNDLWRIDFPQ